MKAGDLKKRLRWFDKGAAAFSQVFPDALTFLGPSASPHYACPECAEPDADGLNYKVQLFPRAAVQQATGLTIFEINDEFPRVAPGSDL